MQKLSCLDFHMTVKIILLGYFPPLPDRLARDAQKRCDAVALCPNLSEGFAPHARA